MKTIEELREVLHYVPETGEFTWKVKTSPRAMLGSLAGSLTAQGYWVIGYGGRAWRAHRLAWAMTYGEWPAGLLDHINGDRADNRLVNLRPATPSQNGVNSAKSVRNTSGYKGVSWTEAKQCWRAAVYIGRKCAYARYFHDPEEAHQAYIREATKYHGEYLCSGAR